MKHEEYQPKTGERCHCKRGQQRDNCPACEGTGWKIDFVAIRARSLTASAAAAAVVPLPSRLDDTTADLARLCEEQAAQLAALRAALHGAVDLLRDSSVRFHICDGGRGHLGEQAMYHRTLDAARSALAGKSPADR